MREKWFAWKPVYAGGSPDGTRAKGWVWLKDVEVLMKPLPGSSIYGARGGLYRKLSKGRVDSFGLRQAHDFADEVHARRWVPPTLATDTPIYRKPPVRGEADQFGGPRVMPSDYDAFLSAAARSDSNGLTYDEWKRGHRVAP